MRPLKFVPDNTNIRFLSYRWWALALSILLLTSSVALVAINGLNWGIDFVGGQSIRVTFQKPVNMGDLRGRLEGLDVGDVVIQQMTDPKVVSIRIPLEGEATNPIGKCLGQGIGKEGQADGANKIASTVRAELVKSYPGVNIGAVNSVSGKVGCELFSTGSLALTLAMLGISLFIWFRFEWQFGVGALVTLFHDVVLTFGFFALTRLSFDLNVIAAILTIIGYSLNDTIVIYDRIRENLRKYRKMEIEPLLNLSVNETLSRTVTTSMSLILTLSILLLVGPDSIFGFTASMLLGIVIGTFSSFYISAPVLIWLNVTSDSFVQAETPKGAAERISESFPGQK
ncbi:protein translocase subunit SecF [Chakrabartia godavariana]|jgi:preprotein translocase subunit SecF|nr:protein translocase subunit SecF [Chakrabartia godavariana]